MGKIDFDFSNLFNNKNVAGSYMEVSQDIEKIDPLPEDITREAGQNQEEKNGSDAEKNKEGIENNNICDTVPAGAGFNPDFDKFSDDLPPDYIDIVLSLIDDYCSRFNIPDMQKASAHQWRGACMWVGMQSKGMGLYNDIERTARHGTAVYSTNKLLQALEVWAFLCSSASKVPLISDFISFVHVDSDYFYNCNGVRNLTSSDGRLRKRMQEIQEGGLSSGFTDKNGNTVGLIFLSKARFGWRDDGVIINNSSITDGKIDALPVFDADSLPKVSDHEKNGV